MSVSVIVFSRDRAMQLDALLSSYYENVAGGPLPPTPTVLWTASTPEYEAGYRKLFNTHASWCGFVTETNFNDESLALLPKDGYVMYLMDDDVIWGKLNLGDAVRELDADNQLAAFSFRLGCNTTRCYPLGDIPQAEPLSRWITPNGTLSWKWVGAEHDFGYPFSLDGHVLRVEDVRAMLEASVSHNPNQIEQTLASRAWMRSSMRPKMASYARSVVTGVPANVVNTTHPNRNAGLYDPAWLNALYLGGSRIDWRAMNWDCVDAAHVVLPYVFTNPLADKEAA